MKRLTYARRAFFGGILVCGALIICASFRYFASRQPILEPYVVMPKPPPLPSLGEFSCLSSPAVANHKDRTVAFHGSDWILISAIKPSCLPEKDSVLWCEVGRYFMNKPVMTRSRLWVTRKHGVTFVRIAESSHSEEQDMVAVGLLTNHRCTSRKSKNCSIEGGPILLSMD
jgi:hypothetical protein